MMEVRLGNSIPKSNLFKTLLDRLIDLHLTNIFVYFREKFLRILGMSCCFKIEFG